MLIDQCRRWPRPAGRRVAWRFRRVNVQRFAAAYLRPGAGGDTPNRFCAGSVYGGPARMGKLLGPAARDRGTWGNRPAPIPLVANSESPEQLLPPRPAPL